VADKIGAKEQAAEANRKKAESAPVITPEKIVEQYFVRQARVHLNAGHTYGKGGENHVRMNVATSRKLLQTALDNMAAALATL